MSTYQIVIESLQGLTGPIVAIFGAIILWKQFRLEKQQWRLSLYDKRYRIFENTMKYITFVVQNARLTNEVLFDFNRNSGDYEFLFGGEIKAYHKELWTQGSRLVGITDMLQGEPVGEQRTKYCNESSEICKWFSNQYEESSRLFGEYLRVDQK